MRLKSRLTLLQSQAGAGGGTTASEPATPDLHSRLARLKPAQRPVHPEITRARLSEQALARYLDGGLIAEGLIHIRRRLPLQGRCGSIELTTLQTHPHLPGESPGESRRGVYIDTETTGLSGGSGTLAFLLGSARLITGAIELEQWLLTRFAAEPALLAAFSTSLTTLDRLISYNGKSYDLPLLATRYRMQALPHPCAELPHLDLLHPVRRLFGRHWPDCRLTTLEQRLLGLTRHNDLPGAQAPAAWFDYLRQGDGERLIRVVEHNRQDILSLVLAHTALAQAIGQPQRFGVDLTAPARWLAETDATAAQRLLQSQREDLDDEGKRLLARLARRDGDWPLALTLWRELAARGCTDSLECLAKYHEHVSKDLSTAKHYSEQLPAEARHEHRRLRLAAKWAARQNSLF